MAHCDPVPWIEGPPPAERPYALTGGRTEPSHPLDLASLVKARDPGPAGPTEPVQAEIVGWCRTEPLSVAEIAGRLFLPVQVVKVLLGDLLTTRHLIPSMPAGTNYVNRDQLERLLVGLRNL
ncbi:DUF742 domain-containing protein [Streptomyces sp. NPDC058280]|uniref:DUF742 domain-containing protein n=1 Tax=Streptomyces sp. NPDC058280 TaxID=3346419 RepID=UPI0036F14BB2